MEHSAEINNVYALTIDDHPIHISKARSGRKGYYCMGCKREMQAVLSQIANRASYFRHDPKAVKNGQKCTYSDETYRHKLAKDILQITKQIRVSAVYKYPPKGVSGKAILIKKSETIQAYKVRNELSFYEDENGIVKWGRNPDLLGKFLLIKPDVTFFDLQNQPILLIEIVATHKINTEKFLRIKRLGIDTVQITIPKDSPQEIERTFSITDRTTWVYNNFQENAEYIPTSDTDSEGISFTDEIPTELFQESFACRSSQVKNLIRSIERCLESKPYRETESAIRSEILRVTENTKREQERLLEFEDSYRAACEGRTGNRREELRREQEKIDEQYSNLERRYINKAAELTKEERLFKSGRGASLESINNRRNVIISKRVTIEEQTEKIEREIISADSAIGRVRKQIVAQPEDLRKSEGRVREWAKNMEESEKSEIDSIGKEKSGIPEQLERDRRELEARYAEIRREITGRANEGSIGKDEFSRKLKKVHEAIALFSSLEDARVNQSRIIRAKECFDSDAYKDWIEREKIL